MALISCPECNHQVSDKALCCPNCGFPINNISNDQDKSKANYDIELVSLSNNANKIKIIGNIRGLTGWGLAETKALVDFPPKIILKNLGYDSAINAQKAFSELGAETRLIPISSTNEASCYSKADSILKNYDDKTIICPHCGSTAVTTGQRGFSFLTGFLGSNKTVNRCGKCGWTWQPK